jgi:hypothetical protein
MVVPLDTLVVLGLAFNKEINKMVIFPVVKKKVKPV